MKSLLLALYYGTTGVPFLSSSGEILLVPNMGEVAQLVEHRVSLLFAQGQKEFLRTDYNPRVAGSIPAFPPQKEKKK